MVGTHRHGARRAAKGPQLSRWSSLAALLGLCLALGSCGCDPDRSLLSASSAGLEMSVDCDGDGVLDGPVVAGTVWVDPDFDGVRQPGDLGVGGVSVDLYGLKGEHLGRTQTDALGRWRMDGVASPYGVLVHVSAWPEIYSPGFAGPDNGTVMQRIVGATCSAHVALQPSLPCGPTSDLRVATTCFVAGTHDGDAGTDPGLVSFPSDAQGMPSRYAGTNPDPADYPVVGPDPRMDATVRDLGTTFGLAFQPRSQLLYAGAVLRRHSGLGALGLGGLYVFDYQSSPVSRAASIDLEGAIASNDGLPLHFGTVDRSTDANFTLPADPTVASRDLDAFAKAGIVGMGDLDFEENERALWLVNLHERSLVRIDASDIAALTPVLSAEVRRYFITLMPGLPASTTGVMRPFGLKFYGGRGYLGVVDSAETSQDRDDARAYVLSFDPANPESGFVNEVEFRLNYTREREHTSLVHDWQAWARDENDLPWVTGSRRYAQAMVADIEFDSQGDMTIGLGDRFGLQTGYTQLAIQRDYAGSARMTGSSSGDILKACRVGAAFILEGRPGCEVNDLALGDPDGPRFPLANDGPAGNGEFYAGDFHENTHSEVGTGGALTVVPLADRVLYPVQDPLHNHDFHTDAIWSQGIHGYSTRTGERSQRYLIVPGPVIETFGKGTGIGDLELVCAPAPIEVGGTVFYDENTDQRRTGGDTGMPGITVELLLDGALVATTATNGAGRYAFRDASVAGGLQPLRSGYRIRVHLSQPALASYHPVAANAGGSDALDSDGETSIVPGYAAIDVMTGKGGSADHTHDFGFSD